MDSRIEEIDNFLKCFAEIVRDNPKYNFDPDFWYAQLSGYGYTNEESSTYIRDQWDELIEHFKVDPNKPDNYNLNVYNDARQTRFLQIRNARLDSKSSDFYKMYISFDKEHIIPATKLIFDFVRNNGMRSASKLSERLRSDSIVLRIENEDDVVKLLNFINNNDYLVRNARVANPFIFRMGKVGLAYDANLSYNETVSEVLYNYFYIKRLTNSLDSVSYEDFASYAKSYGTAMYSSGEAIEYISNLQSFKNCEQGRGMSKADVHDNYKKILDLIGKSVQKDFTINDFFELINKYKNKRFEDNIRSIGTPTERLDQNDINEAITLRTDNVEQKLLDEYINYALSKYRSIDVIADALRVYSTGTKITSITRDKNFRERFRNTIWPTHIHTLTSNDINAYVLKIHNNKIDKIFEGLVETYRKYGLEQLNFAIQRGIEGNYSYITNGANNYRSFIKENVTIEEFQDALVIINNTYPLDKYDEAFRNAISSAIGRKR